MSKPGFFSFSFKHASFSPKRTVSKKNEGNTFKIKCKSGFNDLKLILVFQFEHDSATHPLLSLPSGSGASPPATLLLPSHPTEVSTQGRRQGKLMKFEMSVDSPFGSVFRIRFMLIRLWILGSVSFWYVSGSSDPFSGKNGADTQKNLKY